MKKLLFAYLALAASAYAADAANDVLLVQRNATNDDNVQVNAAGTANAILRLNASKVAESTLTPAGLTSVGTDAVNSGGSADLTINGGTDNRIVAASSTGVTKLVVSSGGAPTVSQLAVAVTSAVVGTFGVHTIGGNQSQIHGIHANGTFASPTATTLASGRLFRLLGQGYGATAYKLSFDMSVEAGQDWTDSVQGTRVYFNYTLNGAGSRTTNVVFSELGNLLVGTTTDPAGTGGVKATAFFGTLTGNVTGNVSGSSGSTTGNAATVTTNANLSGDVTSVGNTTTLAAGSASNLNSGTLALARGGTGQGTAATAFNALSPMTAAGDIIYGGASGAGTRLAAGTSVQVLHGGTTPSWAPVSLTADVSGVLPVANGGTNASSASITAFNNITGYSAAGATGTTSTNLVFSTSPNIATPSFTTNFTLANGASPTTSSVAQMAFDTDAWAASRGAVAVHDGTATTWLVGTLASDTPTNGQVPTWNTGGTITWETPGGGGVTSVATTAGITGGTITTTGTLSLDLTYSPIQTGIWAFTPTARSSGVAPYWKLTIPTDTGVTAATEAIGYQHATGTRTWATTGTVALQRENFFAGPTYASAGASQTFTDAFTLYATPPIAGTQAIFTRGHTFGIVDSTASSSSITGGFIVATTLGTTATSVGIGNGNINAGGSITAGTMTATNGLTMQSSAALQWNGSNGLYATSSGIATIYNGGNAGFTRFNFGGTTTTYPSIGFETWGGITPQSAAGSATWNDVITANSGTLANRYSFGIAAPTYTSTGTSVTDTVASTVYIAGAPTASTNTTIGTAYALNVASGTTLLQALRLGLAAPLSIVSGTNQRAGNATLTGGTVTVNNTTVTANSILMLTRKTSGGTIGTAITYTTSAATSFTINSDNILDTSTFSYIIVDVP